MDDKWGTHSLDGGNPYSYRLHCGPCSTYSICYQTTGEHEGRPLSRSVRCTPVYLQQQPSSDTAVPNPRSRYHCSSTPRGPRVSSHSNKGIKVPPSLALFRVPIPCPSVARTTGTIPPTSPTPRTRHPRLTLSPERQSGKGGVKGASSSVGYSGPERKSRVSRDRMPSVLESAIRVPDNMKTLRVGSGEEEL